MTGSLHGQELNSESYAICKADMLIKGQTVSNIKLGNILSDDQLATSRFDVRLSNPPVGVEWKKLHTTADFWPAYAELSPKMKEQARKAYQL